MEQYELLRHVVRCFEKQRIPYFITGALAAIAYGEPRLTNDIDIVAEIGEDDVAGLKNCYPESEFYFDKDAAREAVRRQFQFNIIHPGSGLKVDVMASKRDEFDKSRFLRARRLRPLEDTEANFASPEDVILIKMLFCKKGESEKHLRDIAGILKISGDMIDFSYIADWVKRLGVEDIWEAFPERPLKT